MVTGTVNLSLADVDKLRQDVKEAQTALKAKEEELAQVKADKRTVLVEKTNPLRKDYLRITVSDYNVRRLVEALSQKDKYEYSPFGHRGSHGYSDISVSQYVDVELHDNHEDKRTSYINFDDVEQEIRRKIEQDISEEVAKLKADTKLHIEKVADVEAKWQRKNLELQKGHDEVKEKLKKEFEDLLKKYRELEAGKKELTVIEQLNEKLANLERQLIEEQNKKWYQKF